MATMTTHELILTTNMIEDLLTRAALGQDSTILIPGGLPHEVRTEVEDALGLGQTSGVEGDVRLPRGILEAAWPDVLAYRLDVLETRCAGSPESGHSHWAYGSLVRMGEGGVRCSSCGTDTLQYEGWEHPTAGRTILDAYDVLAQEASPAPNWSPRFRGSLAACEAWVRGE